MVEKSPNILLLGGGYVLSRLARSLDTNSFIITTRKENNKFISYNHEIVDYSDINNLKRIFVKYPSIRTIIDSIPPKDFKGVNNLSLCVKDFNINRLIYLSTTGVFGVSDGSVVNEKTKCSPVYDKSKLRYESELIYRNLNIDFTALRVSGIYGPKRGIGIALKEKRYPFIDNGSRWSNRIHVDDLVNILKKSLEKSNIGKVFCISDDKPTKTKEIVDFYCKKFNLFYPKSITLKEAKDRGVFTLLSNQRVSNKLVKKVLGIKLKYPDYTSGAGEEFKNE